MLQVMCFNVDTTTRNSFASSLIGDAARKAFAAPKLFSSDDTNSDKQYYEYECQY